ncbi:MAG: DUF1904 family protein [Cellulosilyticaceae bacterium]
MPMLRIKGFSPDKVSSVSTLLVEELHQIIGCPKDYFTLEVIQNSFIYNGNLVTPPTIIEVAWFDRGQVIQDAAAKCITKYFGIDVECLEVYFVKLNECDYYENGEHF